MLEKLLRDAVILTEHCKRNTVFIADVATALKNQGKVVYGL